ncbi:vacuolar membrane protein [Flagelloscypha sp. PMI_526]|nr:vacuolar membrane protein [Flagelloscypha sp. PMI_526]
MDEEAVEDVELNDSDGDEKGNLGKALQIDMKGLVGDALGNMSISPASRDIVLGALVPRLYLVSYSIFTEGLVVRRGLFIIDLDSPFEIPRFLPQGGTWDVADVQWNPHPSKSEYIVSTSSEKLLVWNLNSPVSTSPSSHSSSESAIHHILHAHYRAITDINWHTNEPDIVCSTSIDSWIWAWDLRTTLKPIFGLCAFNNAGTHVKWNRVDSNILASAHGHEVLIWDRRKGSLPLSRIQAHQSRIYGLDWSHHSHSELVTCSLDKTIKVWDVIAHRQPDISVGMHHCTPKMSIRTNYPIWRARHLPFGHGVLSLAQRGETNLEMFSLEETSGARNKVEPVEIFHGHTDVVKEFVWRRGGIDSNTFQLITWSKDRTLRFWPIDDEKVGGNIFPGPQRNPDLPIPVLEPTSFSFRAPPPAAQNNRNTEPAVLSALSAPIGHRSILAEVRAGGSGAPLPRGYRRRSLVQQPKPPAEPVPALPPGSTPAMLTGSLAKRRGTMSRGNGKPLAQMEPFAWLSSIKVGELGNSQSKSRSGERSGSQPKEGEDRYWRGNASQKRGETPLEEQERKDEGQQSLQDELTSVLTKLGTFKIKLEKHDLTKKRTCTLGLHGPWGEFSAVYIRVTFTFPRDYPTGIPTCEVERNPLISNKDRAYMLRRLKVIRESRRPCLEPCLRFLLLASEEDEKSFLRQDEHDEDLSSDEDEAIRRKAREITVALLRNNKNLAEPRTSQGTFGPNGELVCFFRAPPRIVMPVLRNLSNSPASHSQEEMQPLKAASRTVRAQAPALLSDAMRLLSLAQPERTLGIKRQVASQNTTFFGTMTNLFTYSSSPAYMVGSDTLAERDNMDSRDTNPSLVPSRRSTVYLTNTISLIGPDRTVAVDYMFSHTSIHILCEMNAEVAQRYGRFDHERIFKTLAPILNNGSHGTEHDLTFPFGCPAPYVSVPKFTIFRYNDLAARKDVQMLAMLSSIILQVIQKSGAIVPSAKEGIHPIVSPIVHKGLQHAQTGSPDYFNGGKPHTSHSPTHPWSVSPSSPLGQSNPLSTSNSSRGSWSSLFNAAPVRQLISNVQDLTEGLVTPAEVLSNLSPDLANSIPVPIRGRSFRGGSPGARGVPRRNSSFSTSSSQVASVSRSWQESSMKVTPVGARQKASLRVTERRIQPRRRQITFHSEDTPPIPYLFDEYFRLQCLGHIRAYADILFGWRLYGKRLELLNSVNHPNLNSSEHALGSCPP